MRIPPSPLIRIISAALLLAGIVATAGGCATSQPFKVGANMSGPYLAQVTDQYVSADAGISADEKATRYGLTAALREATATLNMITVQGVETAWAPVRPLFVAYTDADATLDRRRSLTPPALSDRQIIQDIGTRLDALIVAEKARPFRLFAPSPTSNP